MLSKTKIIVIKLKDILFYATVAALCIIVLLLLVVLFQPKDTATNGTISVKNGCAPVSVCTSIFNYFFSVDSVFSVESSVDSVESVLDSSFSVVSVPASVSSSYNSSKKFSNASV